MTKIFLDVLNLSITASWLILAVLFFRFVLKKFVPKWTLCLVWALVGIRLVIPFSFESELSLVPSSETFKSDALFYAETSKPSEEYSQIFEENFVSTPIEQNTPNDTFEPFRPSKPSAPKDFIDSGLEGVDKTVNPIIQNAISENEQDTIEKEQKWLEIAGFIWIFGIAAMLLYAAVNYIILKRRVSVFVPEGNIRKSENVESPFILGIFKPKIYLPFGLSEDDEASIIAHEKAHLSRGDHLVKPFSFLILAFYWFNPLCWVAYILLCRDIEFACDEKVVKNMDLEARKSYAAALLHCSTKKRIIAACPVAFGEIGVKARVVNALNYKKPLFWIIVVSIIGISALAVFFLTNPTEETNSSEASIEKASIAESEETSEVGDESSEIIEESSEVDESSEATEETSEVSDESSEIIEESSEVDESSEATEETSEVSDESREIIDESGEVSDESSSEPEPVEPDEPIIESPVKNTSHQTPEVFETRYGYGSKITSLYVKVGNTDCITRQDGSMTAEIIRMKGLKIWICDKEYNKIDYLYTNSNGIARFDVTEGVYRFYFEGGEGFVPRYSHKTLTAYEFNTGDRWILNAPNTTTTTIYTYPETYDAFTIYVTDAQTGLPIPNAECEIYQRDIIKTDEHGVAVTDSLMADYYCGGTVYIISVNADGYNRNDGECDVKDKEIHIQLTKTVYYNVSFTFIDGETLEPIPDIKASFIGKSSDSVLYKTVTGTDGIITATISSKDRVANRYESGYWSGLRFEYKHKVYEGLYKKYDLYFSEILRDNTHYTIQIKYTGDEVNPDDIKIELVVE